MRFPPNRLLSLVVVVAASLATACGDAASEPAAPPPARHRAAGVFGAGEWRLGGSRA